MSDEQNNSIRRYSFQSNYSVVPDAKGRVTLASAFRNEFKDAEDVPLILSVARRDKQYKCITVYPAEIWERELNELEMAAKSEKNKDLLMYVKAMRGKCLPVHLDKAGRILVPQSMLKDCGITSQAKLSGSGEYMELWEPSQYDKFFAVSDELADEVWEKYSVML